MRMPEQDLTPPEPRVIGRCNVCRREIYEGERYGVTAGGKMIHCAIADDDDCVNEEWAGLTVEERAELLGYEVAR